MREKVKRDPQRLLDVILEGERSQPSQGVFFMRFEYQVTCWLADRAP
jgi:hypothetical protein